jgi:hypothetical protein
MGINEPSSLPIDFAEEEDVDHWVEVPHHSETDIGCDHIVIVGVEELTTNLSRNKLPNSIQRRRPDMRIYCTR